MFRIDIKDFWCQSQNISFRTFFVYEYFADNELIKIKEKRKGKKKRTLTLDSLSINTFSS